MKISTPILWETELENFLPKLKQFWETAKLLKRHYPSAWNSLACQYKFDTWGDKSISDELFTKKLEVMIMQDEERRSKN
jgi:hypothetical protein